MRTTVAVLATAVASVVLAACVPAQVVGPRAPVTTTTMPSTTTTTEVYRTMAFWSYSCGFPDEEGRTLFRYRIFPTPSSEVFVEREFYARAGESGEISSDDEYGDFTATLTWYKNASTCGTGIS